MGGTLSPGTLSPGDSINPDPAWRIALGAGGDQVGAADAAAPVGAVGDRAGDLGGEVVHALQRFDQAAAGEAATGLVGGGDEELGGGEGGELGGTVASGQLVTLIQLAIKFDSLRVEVSGQRWVGQVEVA